MRRSFPINTCCKGVGFEYRWIKSTERPIEETNSPVTEANDVPSVEISVTHGEGIIVKTDRRN